MTTTATTASGRPGMLAGVRVLELAGEWSPMAGKLLADLGADVVLVEPVGGHPSRAYEPHRDGEQGPESSLWWWSFHTSKRAIELDLTSGPGRDRFLRLLGGADVLVESERPGDLDALGLNAAVVAEANPQLVWTSVTPYGRADRRSQEPATDLTLMAAAGPVWMCGYDDHALPPVRGEGCQSVNVAGVHGAIATVAALVARQQGCGGQRVDVSVWAALNVATEGGTYEWLTMGSTLLRQTGRHAAARPSMPVQIVAGDGTWVNSGFPPRQLREVEALLGWLADLGRADSPEAVLLGLAREQGGVDLSRLKTDPMQQEMIRAGRDALRFIASTMPAREFFVEAQQRGLAVGIVNSVASLLDDPHVRDRQAWTDVAHDDLGVTFRYPPPPFRSDTTPCGIRCRAPHVGEHNDEEWTDEEEARMTEGSSGAGT